MEADTQLEKILAYMKKAHGDLLEWLNFVKQERKKIIDEAVKENEEAKIAKLKNKIEQL